MSSPTVVQEMNEMLTRKILSEAENDHGFIIAFRGPANQGPLGFGFLAVNDKQMVSLTAYTADLETPLALRAIGNPRHPDPDQFVMVFLDSVAVCAGIPTDELLKMLSGVNHIWRFVGLVDKKVSHIRDNEFAWRALWGRTIEILVPHRLPKELIGYNDLLIERLRRCAHEGQIILDR